MRRVLGNVLMGTMFLMLLATLVGIIWALVKVTDTQDQCLREARRVYNAKSIVRSADHELVAVTQDNVGITFICHEAQPVRLSFETKD